MAFSRHATLKCRPSDGGAKDDGLTTKPRPYQGRPSDGLYMIVARRCIGGIGLDDGDDIIIGVSAEERIALNSFETAIERGEITEHQYSFEASITVEASDALTRPIRH